MEPSEGVRDERSELCVRIAREASDLNTRRSEAEPSKRVCEVRTANGVSDLRRQT
jgi:hypothetical protein